MNRANQRGRGEGRPGGEIPGPVELHNILKKNEQCKKKSLFEEIVQEKKKNYKRITGNKMFSGNSI